MGADRKKVRCPVAPVMVPESDMMEAQYHMILECVLLAYLACVIVPFEYCKPLGSLHLLQPHLILDAFDVSAVLQRFHECCIELADFKHDGGDRHILDVALSPRYMGIDLMVERWGKPCFPGFLLLSSAALAVLETWLPVALSVTSLAADSLLSHMFLLLIRKKLKLLMDVFMLLGFYRETDIEVSGILAKLDGLRILL